MTLIELFDRTPAENILATLALKPDRVIFLGVDPKRARRFLPQMKRVLEGRPVFREHMPELIVKSAAKNDMEAVTDTIFELLAEGDERLFVVDISGGDESLLVSVGIVLGGLAAQSDGASVLSGGKRLHVGAFRMNGYTRRGTLYESKLTDGKLHMERRLYDFSYGTEVYLTVEENVILHGGRILGRGYAFPKDDPASADVDVMWELCRKDPTGWNAKIARMSGDVGQYSDASGLYAIADDALGSDKNKSDRKLWNAFVEAGLILPDKKRSTGELHVFRYKNRVVEECLNKAGSVLEYVTYKAALEAEDDDGVPVFDSAELSVVLDWDEENGGTSNEIDCIAVRGVVPVFLSCKNGDVKTDELYKLDAVSDKFGSGYAKTALVSTVFFDPEAKAYHGDRATGVLKERAEDMGIRLISEVHRLTPKRLEPELWKLVK